MTSAWYPNVKMRALGIAFGNKVLIHGCLSLSADHDLKGCPVIPWTKMMLWVLD